MILVVGVPLLINWLYILGEDGRGYRTKWCAPDALAYFGSVLSLLGTVILGAIAIYQNDNAYRLNQKMQLLESAKFFTVLSINNLDARRIAFEPQYKDSPRMIDYPIEIDIYLASENYSGECYHIDVALENSSEYPVIQCIVCIKGLEEDAERRYGVLTRKEQYISLPSNKVTGIRFFVPCEPIDATEKDTIDLDLSFVNVFGYATKMTVSIGNLQKPGDRKTRACFQYRLAKFSDI